MGFATVAAVLAVLAAQSERDPFVAQRDAAAARNVGSARFTVSVAGDRRTFRVGERISLILHYDDVPNRRSSGEGPCRHYASPVLDRTAGTGDPLRDLYRTGFVVPGGVCGCVEGGVVGGTPPTIAVVEYDANGVPSVISKAAPAPPPKPRPKPPIVTVPYELTEHVRFDTPGRYRLYMSDGVRPAPPLISNIIELEIGPRDVAWERETLRWAVRVLDSSANGEELTVASRTLEVLPSRDALDEMARRGHTGLFGARDRNAAIAALTRQVDDPRSTVGDFTLRELAALHATRMTRGSIPASVRYDTLLRAHTRRLRALARAGMLVERIGAAFQADLTAKGTPVPPTVQPLRITHALAAFPADVAAALVRLPGDARETILTLHRRVFGADARFAPMLERLARAGSAAATAALHDADAARARPIIRRDLMLPRPRLPIAVSGLLADDTLPALDAAFLRQLESAAERTAFAATMDRIERYGTAAIAPRVRRAYEARDDAHACSIAIPALAFFFRTDPAFAATAFDAVRRSSHADDDSCPQDWRVDLPATIAARRPSPALETFAGTLVGGNDAEAAVNAAVMLAEHGSAAAKSLVWRGLASWQSRWSADEVRALAAADPSTWESVLEERLLHALDTATRWQLDADEYKMLRAACRGWSCRYLAAMKQEQAALHTETAPSIRPGFDPDLSGGTGTINIAGAMVRLRELPAELQRFPRGTAFVWREPIPGGPRWDLEDDAGYRRVERIVRRAGMSLSER